MAKQVHHTKGVALGGALKKYFQETTPQIFYEVD
jgi:hypothetical protein